MEKYSFVIQGLKVEKEHNKWEIEYIGYRSFFLGLKVGGCWVFWGTTGELGGPLVLFIQ